MPSSKNYKRNFLCEICGIEFFPHPKGAPKAKFCSKKCQTISNQATERQYARLNSEDNPKRYFKALLSQPDRKGLGIDELMELWDSQDGKCEITGLPMTYKRVLGQRIPTNASIDRIQAGGPYIISNVRLVCAVVNKMRLDLSDIELRYWCNAILQGL